MGRVREKLVPKIKWIFRYSGLEFVYRKFNPSNPQTLPTGLIWLVGIYVAFFGVASQRYENRIDIIENRANSIFAQLAVPSVTKKALSKIARVQNMPCPRRPEILKPPSVFISLFSNSKYEEMVEQLKETIEDWKESLDSVNLRGAYLREAKLRDAKLRRADLRGADLRGAYLRGANLWGADLEKADLREADLVGADLGGANLMEAELVRADLREADLRDANLRRINLRGADLEKANLVGAVLRRADLREAVLRGANNLTREQLCRAKTLYHALLDDDLREQVEKMCPHLLEGPDKTDKANE